MLIADQRANDAALAQARMFRGEQQQSECLERSALCSDCALRVAENVSWIAVPQCARAAVQKGKLLTSRLAPPTASRAAEFTVTKQHVDHATCYPGNLVRSLFETYGPRKDQTCVQTHEAGHLRGFTIHPNQRSLLWSCNTPLGNYRKDTHKKDTNLWKQSMDPRLSDWPPPRRDGALWSRPGAPAWTGPGLLTRFSSLYTYMYICTYIYTYIYIHTFGAPYVFATEASYRVMTTKIVITSRNVIKTRTSYNDLNM